MAELSDEEVFGGSKKEWTDEQIFGSPSKGTAMPGQVGVLAGKTAQNVKAQLAQKDPDVDYSGVPDPTAQAAYSLITKPEDRTTYLQSRYGKENVSKDSFGRDVVNVNGKRIAFQSREPGTSATFLQDIAGHAGDVAPVGGMVAGGIAGIPSGGLASVGLAGLGAGAGVAANSLIAQALGLPSTQSAPEVSRDILRGIAQGIFAETLGQGAMLAGRSVLGPYKPGSIFGPWEANRPLYEQQMADLAAARETLPGIRPKVGTFAPNAPLVQRLQTAGNRVFGDEGAVINRPIIQGRADELAAQAGQGAIADTTEPAVSNALSRRADLTVERAKFNADVAMKDANVILRKAQEDLESRVGTSTGKVAGMADADITANRKAFGDKASDLYGPIDAMAGKPAVSTQTLKDASDAMIESLPKTESGQLSVLVPEKLRAFVKGIKELPEYITFQEMQAIRNKFFSTPDINALDAGLTERQALLLGKAADASFDAAAKNFPEAVTALRRADTFYKAGMKRFNDLSVQALVKDASETGYIQPEKVAKFIATPGQLDKLLRIKKVVSPETFEQVGAERWKQMVSDSEDVLTGQIDGKKLSKQLSDMGPSLDALYGPKANEMRNLARQWAVLGGKAEEVSSPAFLREAVEKQAKANELQKTQWLANIGRNGPESLQAADYLTQPNNRYVFNQARKTFGENSAEISATKEYLARKIFSVMEQPATKGAEKYGKTELMGQPLINELNRYGRPYLEDVFGKEWTDSAYNFAKAAEVATRKNPSDAGAIVVAAYALRPFSHIGGLVKMFGAQEILSSPAAITYMTKGIESGAVDFIRNVSALATRGGLAYRMVKGPQNAEDYGRAATYKVRNQLQPRPLPPETMQGVRG